MEKSANIIIECIYKYDNLYIKSYNNEIIAIEETIKDFINNKDYNILNYEYFCDMREDSDPDGRIEYPYDIKNENDYLNFLINKSNYNINNIQNLIYDYGDNNIIDNLDFDVVIKRKNIKLR